LTPAASSAPSPAACGTIERRSVTLHVGPGHVRCRFATDELAKSARHAHRALSTSRPRLPPLVARARQEGRKILAIGTTVVRALESADHSYRFFSYGDAMLLG
jgi:S-adenosylmethionine:tRNA-ribosyltransferase-isomerase (queuine synthetase)